MKKLAIVFAVAATLAACNNQAEINAAAKAQAQRELRDSLKLDSFQRAEAKHIEEQKINALAQQKANNIAASRASSNRTYVKGVSETYTYPQEQKKKGWSQAAKGAAIGAGAGAVTGILVDKKDGRGAIIGGVVGAGTGYAIGRSQDKKSGRAQ